MRRVLYTMMSMFVICGCGHSVSDAVEPAIDPTICITEEERAARIAIDFSRDSAYVIEYLKPFYPELTAEQVQAWEATNALENMVIDGQKRYFRNAGRNLFRIDKDARAVYEAKYPVVRESDDAYMDAYLPKVIEAVRTTGENLVMPETFTVTYGLTVKADAVPAGETIRAWMPYPREDQNSIKDVQLIEASEPEYVISSDNVPHKSIYMEKQAVAGEPTVFTYKFKFTCFNEWYDIKPEDVKPYDTESELYKTYTAERQQHIIFTDQIRHLTDSLVAGETNPYLKVRAIYKWIVDSFPWASAREYSTIENIPMYVINNRHGDCGQVGLLLVTMCRYAGVPARWQSGWMLHHDAVNMHDWSEIYYEGIGWVPTDVSFGRGRQKGIDSEDVYNFYASGLDGFRLIGNIDYGGAFEPAKEFIRSETVDFQRGEVEWKGGNLYLNQWSGWIEDVQYE